VQAESGRDGEKILPLHRQREYLLNGKPVAELTGNEFQKDEIPLTEKVTKFYNEKYGGAVERQEIGKILLDRRGIKDSIAHGIGRNKSAAFAAVPDIIQSGIIIDEQDNWKGRGYDSFTIAAPLKIGETDYIGCVIIKKTLGTKENKYYLHEVILKENLQYRNFKTDTKADSHKGDIANILKKIIFRNEIEENIRFRDAEELIKDGALIPSTRSMDELNEQLNREPSKPSVKGLPALEAMSVINGWKKASRDIKRQRANRYTIHR
ncbi:MAG: hypothetical protein RR015_06670, partial [Bacteroidales bacterium]